MIMRSFMRLETVLVTTLALAAGLMPGLASAHEVGLSRGEYRLRGSALQAELTFARGELLELLPALDADKDRELSAADLSTGWGALQGAVGSLLSVSTDGGPCAGELRDAKLVEEDGVAVQASFACGGSPARASVELVMLQALAHGHRHIARASFGEETKEAVLLRSAGTLEVGTGGAEGSAVGAMFASGVSHILGGLDHLVFLFALILIGGRLRGLLATITAFTVAHSLTLGLAVLGIWAPSPTFVEPLIALSVAYVGLENFFVKSADRRWLITFPFGLVHGFGFAGALGELAVPKDQLVPALVSFNVGVELGQLAVLAVVLPLLLWARRSEWFRVYGVRGLSSVVVLLGLGWFVLRVFGD